MYFTTKIGLDKAAPGMLEQAFRSRIPVEGVVEKEIKGGYEIKLGDARAFCPYSQMGAKRVDNPGDYLGKHLTFKIQEFKENGRNIIVSNRVIHEEAQQELMESLKASLKEGATVRGAIASVQDFGAFVDIGGIQALLPVSEIARGNVDDIRSVLSVGQEVEAVILKLDWKNERFSLSMKKLLTDPWDSAVENYPIDSKHSGKVVRVTDFGAFVSLEPGLDGLIHISELKVTGRPNNPKDLPVKVGQTLSVKIGGIDRASKRISLKPATTTEEDETSQRYLESQAEGATYNPFAALLKNR